MRLLEKIYQLKIGGAGAMGNIEDIRKKIASFIISITPIGTRLMSGHNTSLAHVYDIRICCDGSLSIQAYYCGLNRYHTGRCYSFNKNVPFDREN